MSKQNGGGTQIDRLGFDFKLPMAGFADAAATLEGCRRALQDMTIVRLAVHSLRNRWLTASLTVLAISTSIVLLLGVEKIRTGAKASFANTISGTDLVIGARSGGIQLLLYAVFRIGHATNNMTWQSYEDIRQRPEVDWIIPLSLGDSHRGFHVLGTTQKYFDYYKYRQGRSLAFAAGERFDDLFDAVIGADVAHELGYKVGDEIVVMHGFGKIGLNAHDDKPFRISGILAKTGTPVDFTVHVSLEAIEAIHIDWQGAMRRTDGTLSADDVRQAQHRLRPKAITAAMVGLKPTMKVLIFKLQRYVNTYRYEPLSAILPGATLHELWGLVSTAETALKAVSFMVVVTAILGMATTILATLNERRREIAILRSVGAGPRTVIGLLVSEAFILTLAGVILGIVLTYVLLLVLQPWIDASYGLYLEISPLSPMEFGTLAIIVVGGAVAGFLPALRAYRYSLADGMSVRS